MWTITCVIFGSSLLGLACSFLSDEPVFSWVVQGLCALWMLHGATRLHQGGWRSSYKHGATSWLLKDSLAMLIWPVLYNWIAQRAERE